MGHYRIFTGAPSLKDLGEETGKTYRWQTVSSQSALRRSGTFQTLPPATIASASRRISLLYENIIFQEDSNEEAEVKDGGNELDDAGADQTTAITWPPTAEESAPNQGQMSRVNGGTESFLRRSTSLSRIIRSQQHNTTSALIETQETQETGSYDYSDAESVARFPSFQFSLHRVTPLSALSRARPSHPAASPKVSVLAAVLEVDGPDTIRIKKGVDAGKEVSLLKLILGDEDGAVCKLTAWREVAEAWGGSYATLSAPAVKRGDIVLLENVLPSPDHTNPTLTSLTASPNLKSQMEICFRTLPSLPEDARYRPDLRLGISDSAVRKVAAVVAWFESMAGLR
ncbi:hypothetical protein EIP91_008532 [Steccherinum ochraceum]|uniref:OB domain-containing protein n=1 Tax=Steccherinum ochraceum TaxID=92696 RepID=A0A4R0RCQ7_9APHY|nr:hypothetical protein EIP91_008532 [Steccherinum ochraceum]